jgi:hypothetical protein
MSNLERAAGPKKQPKSVGGGGVGGFLAVSSQLPVKPRTLDCFYCAPREDNSLQKVAGKSLWFPRSQKRDLGTRRDRRIVSASWSRSWARRPNGERRGRRQG